MMRFGGYGCNIMGGGFPMMIIPLIIIGALIFLFYKKGHNNNSKDIGDSDNSLNILKERYARGEINDEEYTNKKNILLNHKE